MSKKHQRIKTILLDVGGTLDADGRDWRNRFHGLFSKRNYHIDPIVFNRAFFDADDFLPIRYPLSQMDLTGTVRALAESLCRNLPGTGDLAAGVAEEFLEDVMAHFNRNKPILSKLRTQYRIGLVSNYYGNLDNALKETGLDRYIDAAVDSDRIGIRKPDPVIFLTALEALNTHPAEALFVGDSFTRDIVGAQQVGIEPLWLVPSHRNGTHSENTVSQIHSFTELPTWLEASAS